MLKATVSGSFHRHMAGIYAAVGELREFGVAVLSPSDPRVVDKAGEFLFVASDRLRSIRLVQDRHVAAIRASDFLWVVCPDGYTGASTCMEIGAALAGCVPVFASSPALDVTIGEYVQRVSGFSEAIVRMKSQKRIERPTSVLLDPERVIDQSIDALSLLRHSLLGKVGNGRDDAEHQFDKTRHSLIQTFTQ